jgi:hypothetical protein
VSSGHAKLKVRQLVYAAFSRDERTMGFAYARAERDGLVASALETFLLPSPAARAWDLDFADASTRVRGRSQVLEHLAGHPTPRPPAEVEVRDGQLYGWRRG